MQKVNMLRSSMDHVRYGRMLNNTSENQIHQCEYQGTLEDRIKVQKMIYRPREPMSVPHRREHNTETPTLED